MAVEPTSIAGAVFSGITALIKITQQSANFVKVPNVVEQLSINVHLADDAIGTANRLLRETPSRILGDRLVDDVMRSIRYTETVLQQLRDAIEDCSRDLKVKKTVSVKNRAAWMLWKEKEFADNLATLTNALTALNRDIGRMEIAVRASSPGPGLPGYESVVRGEWGGGHGGRGGGRASFPRAPSMRRRPVVKREKMGREEVDLEEDGFDDAATLNEETYPDAGELEGSEVDYTVKDDQGLGLGTGVKMPPLVHMMSAPDELPQTTLGRWPYGGGRDGLDGRDDVLGDLRAYKDDDGFLKPTGTSVRRRSNFI